MADGDYILQKTRGSAHIKLIDAAVANDNGQWVDCGEYAQGIIVITGNAGGATVVNVHVSNAATQPSNASAEFLSTALAAGANGTVTLTALPRWIKCSVTAYATGTIVANAALRALI